MSRVIVAAGLLGWAGATMLLGELRWFRRTSLADRLRPYAPRGMRAGGTSGWLSATTLRDVVAPLASSVGARLSRAFGVSEELDVRPVSYTHLTLPTNREV